uniref:Probable protein-export membrane protein SecG n=1 Tax=Betaphycus gelatinus TaxID=1191690 RepID=A0A8E7UEY9_9FLOR|nr:preprotein translocase subunit G [Betaphycus gelatinus]
MRLIWYLVAFINILLILLNNPKSNNFNSIGAQVGNLKSTRSTQRGLQILISISIVVFFMLTIFSVMFLYL